MKTIILILLYLPVSCQKTSFFNQNNITVRYGDTTLYNPHLIELLGQSNAQGSATTGLYPDLSGALSGCYIYDFGVTQSFNVLQQGVNNLQLTTHEQGGFGVELRLMKMLKDYYSKNQYMIKCTLYNTGLAQNAASKDWSPSSTGELYDTSNAVHSRAVVALPNNKPPKALIWIQGEFDCNPGGVAATNAYQTNLSNFIAAKRSAYGYANMPFIIVKLGNMQLPVLNATNFNTIRSAQDALATQPNVYAVSADGAPTQVGNEAHYTAYGYDLIARRIFDVLIKL